ncbi:MAG: type III toxin-antitoxin system CptIN family toxin [Clostridium sp.]|uniref:type III toxin-antitoxin system CptIN family toxin n=1 Tax=Clostridium sp. TaxID=1506 RepID=UPI003D6D98A2
MEIGNFYFLNNNYFIDFPDGKLMSNSETVQAVAHDRPCFYTIYDVTTSLFWLIPFSSQVSKYRFHYQKKVDRYGICDTIAFGEVLGHEKAFLIQNMCPSIPRYIKNEYVDNIANIPVRLDGVFEKELIIKAKRVLALHRKGKKLIFPDVLQIEKDLIREINNII